MNANIFWVSMIQIFGGMWVRERGEQPNQMWVSMIGDHDEATIQKVVDHFKYSGHAFPPTLSEAGAVARQFKGTIPGIPGPGHTPQKPRPLPSQEDADAKIKAVTDALQNGQKRRTTFIPGESFQSYQEAWAKAFRAGKTLAEFESERFLKNGWTSEDEVKFNNWKADIFNKPRARDADAHCLPSIPF